MSLINLSTFRTSFLKVIDSIEKSHLQIECKNNKIKSKEEEVKSYESNIIYDLFKLF